MQGASRKSSVVNSTLFACTVTQPSQTLVFTETSVPWYFVILLRKIGCFQEWTVSLVPPKISARSRSIAVFCSSHRAAPRMIPYQNRAAQLRGLFRDLMLVRSTSSYSQKSLTHPQKSSQWLEHAPRYVPYFSFPLRKDSSFQRGQGIESLICTETFDQRDINQFLAAAQAGDIRRITEYFERGMMYFLFLSILEGSVGTTFI